MGSFGGEIAAKKKAMWLNPKVMGFNPPERWGHSACFSNGFVYVFGGCCGGLHFSDVLVLNLDTMAWNNLVTMGHGPGPRDSHSAVLVEHKMIVFGGTNGSRKVSEIHILDLRSREWTKPNCKGVAPSPRESHTATLVGDEKLVIFGGSGEGSANYLNDLHVLDLKSMCWSSPEVRGDIPVPRDSHSAIAIGKRLFVYGGDCGDRYLGDVDMLDMDTMTWSRLAVNGPSPGVRAGHAAVSFNTKVYIIGGVGDKRYYNDVWILDISSCSWVQLEIRGQQPQGRFSHTAIVTNTDIAIYGGCGEDERPLNELLILQLGAEHGRYNISMCTIFGSQCSQENTRFIQESELIQNTTIMGANIDLVRKEAGDVESESKISFRFGSDTIHPKRRRTANSKKCEIESEPEEHSLSLSQHSSPSHSDQDQTPINKATISAKAAQLFPSKKLHSQVSNHKAIIRQSPLDMYILGENLDQPKPKQNHHVVRNGIRHDLVQLSTAEQKPLEAGHFQALMGADVHGKVDGAFDSGFLMTATVNGSVFRGVLFTPGPQVLSRTPIFDLHHSSQPIQITHLNPQLNHVNPSCVRPSQPSRTLHAPEPVQVIHNFRQAKVGRQSQVARTSSSLGQDQRARSELQGVVLTLGNPGSSGGL